MRLKAYLKDKRVECWGEGSEWTVYIESTSWGTISETGKDLAEAFAKLLETIDAATDQRE